MMNWQVPTRSKNILKILMDYFDMPKVVNNNSIPFRTTGKSTLHKLNKNVEREEDRSRMRKRRGTKK